MVCQPPQSCVWWKSRLASPTCSGPLGTVLQITWPTWLRYSTREVLPEARPSTRYSQPPCHPDEVQPPPHVTVRAGLLLASMVFPGLCKPYLGALMWAQGPALLSGHSSWQDRARSWSQSFEATLPVSLQTAQRLLSQKAALSPHQDRAELGQGRRFRCSALRTT